MAASNTNSSTEAPFVVIPDIPLGLTPVSDEQIVFRYIFATVSFAVNSIVIAVITFSRQLHLPRHAFWAGISFVILFCTAQWVVDLHISRSKTLCSIYELSLGVWYPALLLFLSLAGLDRYVAIKHYEWYQRMMSIRKAIVAMIITWLLNAIIVNMPYWTGYKSLDRCTANTTHMNFIFSWNVVLGIVNMILQAKIFIESRKAIRAYFLTPSGGSEPFHRYLFRDPQIFTISIERRCYGPTIEGRAHDVRVVSSTGHPPVDSAAVTHSISRDQTVGSSGDVTRSGRVINFQCFPLGWKKLDGIDRLDFRAALILSANVLPFWLFTFPLAFYTMAFYWCARLQLSCSMEMMSRADVYVKALFFVPSIYMPLMYMWNSSEFLRAFKHLFRRMESTANSSHRSQRRDSMN